MIVTDVRGPFRCEDFCRSNEAMTVVSCSCEERDGILWEGVSKVLQRYENGTWQLRGTVTTHDYTDGEGIPRYSNVFDSLLLDSGEIRAIAEVTAMEAMP